MLDIIYGYQTLLDTIATRIEVSRFKKEYLIQKLGISRATFYNKVKKKNFTVDEMTLLITLLYPEEAKAFEIKEALRLSRGDSDSGKVREHRKVMADVRQRLSR